MRQVKSCGVLVFRSDPDPEFLLMQHEDRLDLPKGHQETGESELETALREFHEETGIAPERLRLDPGFRYTSTYTASYARFDFEPVEKTLVVFLGFVDGPAEVQTTEHLGHAWHRWNPPHAIQERAIDPLLAAVAAHGLSAGTDETT